MFNSDESIAIRKIVSWKLGRLETETIWSSRQALYNFKQSVFCKAFIAAIRTVFVNPARIITFSNKITWVIYGLQSNILATESIETAND